MMEKARKHFLRMTANVESGGDNYQQEHIQYCMDLEQTLRTLEAHLHSSDDLE